MTEIQKYDSNPAPMAAASTTETAGTRSLQNLESQAQAMGNAMKIAEAMCSTAMVPKQFQGKPADGAAAILYGAELGLNAIQSLQQIMVINGKPGIETRTAVALLKNQGYEIRTVESSDESVTVEGVGPRGEHEVSTWDMKRATTAGYTSNSLYKKIPAQMLYSKAAMEVARKIAPHVLSGIGYSTEELRLDAVNMTASRRDDARGMGQVRAALAAKKEQEVQEGQDAPALSNVERVQAVTSREELDNLMRELQTQAHPVEWAELVDAANAKAEEL